MTDFETMKQRIWDDARADKRNLFEKDCKDLMEKASKDIWRIGWSIYPKNISDVFNLLRDVGKWCHEQWLEAMKNGDAPPEDVSPGEVFALVSKLIKESIEKGELPPIETIEWWIDHSRDDEDDEDDEKGELKK